MRRRMTWIIVLGLLFAGVILVGALLSLMTPVGGHPPSYYTKADLRMLTSLTAIKGFLSNPPLSFPQGDIHNLYQWFASRGHGVHLEDLPPHVKDPEKQVFVDGYGRALVYRFPSSRAEAMFDLYSVGANGVDENGEGDDVTAWPLTAFDVYRSKFAGGRLDVEWIRANLGNLERNAQGKIIGAPPERLDRNGEDVPAGANPQP